MTALKLIPQFTFLVLPLSFVPAFASSVEAPGVPNFHQVNEHLYRGGQPLPEGWTSLAKLGVKIVVDLRLEDEHSSRGEAKAVEAAGMKYLSFPMKGVVSPDDAQLRKLLALLESAEGGPIFVHCRRGADRTGTVIGCYRIEHDHWENARAFKEAKSCGMSWTQVGLKQYLKSFRPTTIQAGGVPATAAPAAGASGTATATATALP